MHVQASTYAVLTHKSFPSFESGTHHFPFFVKKRRIINYGALIAVKGL